ncbi:hypothetical protein ACVWZK_008539 [Bradyrhizobium sp. GM0.4]
MTRSRSLPRIKLVDVVGDLAEPQIKAMHQADRVDWDIAC